MPRKMIEEIRSIITELPKNSIAYLFGSVLTSTKPDDLDVLVVYDSVSCPSDVAYERISPTIRRLERLFSLRVDLRLLTRQEEESVSFVCAEGCIELLEAVLTNDRLHLIAKKAGSR